MEGTIPVARDPLALPLLASPRMPGFFRGLLASAPVPGPLEGSLPLGELPGTVARPGHGLLRQESTIPNVAPGRVGQLHPAFRAAPLAGTGKPSSGRQRDRAAILLVHLPALLQEEIEMAREMFADAFGVEGVAAHDRASDPRRRQFLQSAGGIGLKLTSSTRLRGAYTPKIRTLQGDPSCRRPKMW